MQGFPPPPPPGFPGGPAFIPPLPPGWTEHRAPAGQLYWFNPQTNVSTYARPMMPPPPFGFGTLPPHPPPAPRGFQGAVIPIASSSVPLGPPVHFGNGFQHQPPAQQLQSQEPTTDQSGVGKKEKKEKREKPREKIVIGEGPWLKVITNRGNIFYTNKETKESVWTVPEDIKDLIEKMEGEERENKKRKVDAETKAQENEEAGDELIPDSKEGVPAAKKEDDPKEISEQVQENTPPEFQVDDAISDLPVIGEPKKKKQKKHVVREIEDLEEDEEWQRQIAEQMNKEVEEEERTRESRSGPSTVTTIAPNVHIEPPTMGVPHDLPQFNVSPEEAAALFKAMLTEKDINPMAPWDSELPKFINEPRYSAVKILKDRRDLFDEFCKEKLRAQRAAKKTAPEVDPSTSYRELLLTAVTSTRTHFSDFKKAHGKDPRFRNFGKTEGEKEKTFKVWLKELGERKRAEAMRNEERFKAMLKEDRALKAGDKWADVKTRHASDPRYEALNSSSLRESVFNTYVTFLAASHSAIEGPENSTRGATTNVDILKGESKNDRAARAASSLREREEQVRLDKARISKSTQYAKGTLGREESEREFTSLLIDIVRDHKATWGVVLFLLEKDPRFNVPNLSLGDKRQLFEAHIRILQEKRKSSVEALFFASTQSFNTPFEKVLPKISTDPKVTRLVGDDFDLLETLFVSWAQRREKIARREFDELLRESAVVEHWGRLQKKDEDDSGKKVLDEEDDDAVDEEGITGGTDLKEMAKQIDTKAIHAVLKHDKRYLVFDHLREERSHWIEDYISQLTAPKLTVHQKD